MENLESKHRLHLLFPYIHLLFHLQSIVALSSLATLSFPPLRKASRGLQGGPQRPRQTGMGVLYSPPLSPKVLPFFQHVIRLIFLLVFFIAFLAFPILVPSLFWFISIMIFLLIVFLAFTILVPSLFWFVYFKWFSVSFSVSKLSINIEKWKIYKLWQIKDIFIKLLKYTRFYKKYFFCFFF